MDGNPTEGVSETAVAEFREAYPKPDRLNAYLVETEFAEAVQRHSVETIMAGVERIKRSSRLVKFLPTAPDFLREDRFLEKWTDDCLEPNPLPELSDEELGCEGRGAWCADWSEEEQKDWEKRYSGEGEADSGTPDDDSGIS